MDTKLCDWWGDRPWKKFNHISIVHLIPPRLRLCTLTRISPVLLSDGLTLGQFAGWFDFNPFLHFVALQAKAKEVCFCWIDTKGINSNVG
jgi:hypothetical protein